MSARRTTCRLTDRSGRTSGSRAGLRRRAADGRAEARGLEGSLNSAGVVIDAVRLIKLALNDGVVGQLDGRPAT